jgi:DNA replication protein DnaC
LIGQKGFTVTFTTAASLVSQQLEARDERRLLKLQRDLASVCEEWEGIFCDRQARYRI